MKNNIIQLSTLSDIYTQHELQQAYSKLLELEKLQTLFINQMKNHGYINFELKKKINKYKTSINNILNSIEAQQLAFFLGNVFENNNLGNNDK